MSLLRTFIALEIPDELQQIIHKETADLRNTIGAFIRWVPPENIHMTLKSLGNISPANVDILTQIISAETDSCQPFEMRAGGLACIPSPNPPRVQHIGRHAPAALAAPHHGTASGTTSHAYAA